jgi:phenylpyruvate tautomerase PptA (4-oxalocrotonate tautomerase family)
MPLINLYSSAPPPAADAVRQLLSNLSSLLAREIGKPESYVMTNLVPRTDMTFAGTFEPACYAEIKSIGKFKPDQTERISSMVCELLTKSLGVPRSRIYIEFSDVAGYLWGFDGKTFG